MMTTKENICNKPKLKFIGRGSMFNVKEGNTSAYWKDDSGKYMMLIDCGGTVFKRIVELDLLEGVDELVVLITHTHSDHIGSLSDLLFFCIFCKPDIKVTVSCHMLAAQALRNYLDSTGVFASMQRSDNIKLLKAPFPNSIFGLEFIISGKKFLCRVKFIEDPTHTVETISDLSNNIISCGLLLEFEDKMIYYSGDTQKIPYDKLNMCDIDEIYADCAVRTNSPGSDNKYPHYLLYDLYSYLHDISFPLDHVYAMHLDCDGVIEECNRFGINVVENV